MFKIFFIYLLLIHILGDYYFQPEALAEGKLRSLRMLLVHSGVYLAVSVIAVLPVFSFAMLVAADSLAVTHCIIDMIKFYYLNSASGKSVWPERSREIYVIDQLLHIICVFAAAFCLTWLGFSLDVQRGAERFFLVVETDPMTMLSYLTLILLLWKPANVTIKQLLCRQKPCEEYTAQKSGGFIGLLERLIMLIFLSIGQYSAIGLVLTAKSIARYDGISKDKDFAEYYLLGTLLSTMIVVGVYLAIT